MRISVNRNRLWLAAFLCYMALSSPILVAQSGLRSPLTMKSIDEYLLFYPTKFPAGNWEPINLVYQDVYFNSADGTKLHGWYCPSPNARGVVLLAHGNAGHIADRAAWLRYLQQELKLSVFAFDYRGYGRSEGKPTVQGAIEDSAAARAKLRELANVQDKDLILMGESLGGAMVIQLANQSLPRALIVQSTFPSLREVATVHFPNLAWLVPKNKLVSTDAIKNYRGPLLQSHGTEDRTIPFALGKKLFDAAPGPKEFFPIRDADHNDWLTPEYLKHLEQFLQKLP